MNRSIITASKIILGSSSQYRRELLSRLKLPFEVVSPEVDENPLPFETPEVTAMRLTKKKASVIAQSYPDALIIAADQVAAMGNIHLGKPLSHAKAKIQLSMMQGKEVNFYTALCLLNSRTNHLQEHITRYIVKFRPLTGQQIENYLTKEQPYHCAGSAKAEGLGIALIEKMTGNDPNALIGLPLIALVDMLLNENVEVL